MPESLRVPLPGLVDWPALLSRYQCRHDFIDKLLRTACDSQANVPQRLRQAAQDRDLKAVAFLAHNLKSLAGNLCAERLATQAFETDRAARTGADEAFVLAQDMADTVHVLLQELTERVRAESVTGPTGAG